MEFGDWVTRWNFSSSLDVRHLIDPSRSGVRGGLKRTTGLKRSKEVKIKEERKKEKRKHTGKKEQQRGGASKRYYYFFASTGSSRVAWLLVAVCVNLSQVKQSSELVAIATTGYWPRSIPQAFPSSVLYSKRLLFSARRCGNQIWSTSL
jgi:hypothetical protein